MPKTFDSTMKERVERKPRPWVSLFLGRDVGEVRVVNADLSTITAEADKILRVVGPPAWIVHTEFETSYKSDLPLKAQRYNVLARCRHELPVQTVIVLLRPEADGPNLTGVFEDRLPDGTIYHRFLYNVVRVWELPTADILAGDLSLLPLAPVARVSEPELPGLIRRMEERIEHEATPAEARDLWCATYLLLGLNHSQESISKLLGGVHRMKESTTYQAILAEGKVEGRVEGDKQTLLRLGRKRFGAPTPATVAKIDAFTDLETIEALLDRLLEVSSWDELMAQS
jgi:predicted transposase YdaD